MAAHGGSDASVTLRRLRPIYFVQKSSTREAAATFVARSALPFFVSPLLALLFK